MSSDAKRPVINVRDVRGFSVTPSDTAKMTGGPPPAPELDEKYSATMAQLGDALGLKGLGVSVMTVEPGKRAFPMHVHHGNDELFIVLEGEGAYRIGDQEYPITPGEICAAPAGGLELAHQIVNTGSTTLRYVAISTCNDPDVVEYAESGRFGVLSLGAGRSFMDARIRYIGRRENSLDYWDGES